MSVPVKKKVKLLSLTIFNGRTKGLTVYLVIHFLMWNDRSKFLWIDICSKPLRFFVMRLWKLVIFERSWNSKIFPDNRMHWKNNLNLDIRTLRHSGNFCGFIFFKYCFISCVSLSKVSGIFISTQNDAHFISCQTWMH